MHGSNRGQVPESADDVVARATERQLDQNALYMRIKLLVTDQATVITELRGSNTEMREENSALKERCTTYK